MVAKRKLFLTPSRTPRSTKRTRNSLLLKSSYLRPYPGAVLFSASLPGGTFIQTNAVTTGVLATGTAINANTSITGWSTRFGSTFDEYRVVSCTFEIIPLGLNIGVTSCFFSELSLGTPTLTEATERTATFIKNDVQPPKNLSMKWKNRDFSDATWRSISTSFVDATFYMYTDAANFGSPVTATALFLLRPVYVVQFRGLQST